MKWRTSQADFRKRYLARTDAAEAERYDAVVGRLGPEDEDAYLRDLHRVASFPNGTEVLDAGAGTGALCGVLSHLIGLSITALEPAPTMLAKLVERPALRTVHAVQGFCDAEADRALFPAGRFDTIVSRQVVNGLYDPLMAFRNWHHWLRERGTVVVIDGLYGRAAWAGPLAEDVDVLPLAACQGTAAIPYLLELAGFGVEAVEFMASVNARSTTRTPRYIVVARKA